MLINFWAFLDRSVEINTGLLIALIWLLIYLIIVHSLSVHINKFRSKNQKIFYIREIFRISTRAVKTEREAVAKNLHDDISIPLNVIKLNLTKLSRNSSDQLLSEKLITDSLNLLDQSVECIRSVAKELSPPSFMKLGYIKGISELCSQINASESIEVGLIVNSDVICLPHLIELDAYRITKEILNNIIKHSKSPQINISIHSCEKGICTVISYSGYGLDSKMADELSETDNGVGLKSIQKRAEVIGASVQYILKEGNQYQTTIDIPNYAKAN